MLAHLGFSGIGKYFGMLIAIGNGVLMAVVIVIAMLSRGRVPPGPPEVRGNDASSASYSTACGDYLRFRYASQAMVLVGVLLVAVGLVDRFAEEIAWSGALLASTGFQLWPVGRKYLSGTLGKRGTCTLGLALLGSAAGVALCTIYWIDLLITRYSADEFVFIGVFLAGVSIAVAIWIRFFIALFSPVRGSWLTRPVAALLGMLGLLELLLVGWCMS